MKIRLTHKSVLITPRLTTAYNHKTKKSVDIEVDGKPGAYETTIDNLDVAADLLANRDWELVEPELLAVPVIRNDEGFQHPEEFVFSTRGRLTRKQVQKLAEKKSGKKAPKEEEEEDVLPPITTPAAGDANPVGGPGSPGWLEDEAKA